MAKKMKIHAVVGTGQGSKASEKAIVESLRDVVGADDCVNLVWSGKPSEALEVVYDYVLENNLSFVMYHAEGTTPPRVFRESDEGVVQKVRNPDKAAVEKVDNGGAVLYLWDEDEADDQVDHVFDHKSGSALVLELTNGLAPIDVTETEVPEPVEPDKYEDSDEDSEDEDDTRFTQHELESMTDTAVRRYAARIGVKATKKAAIIAELFPEEQPPADDVEDDPTDEQPVLPKVDDVVVVPGTAPKPIGQDLDAVLRSLTNVTPSAEAIETIEVVRNFAKKYAVAIFDQVPASRERSLAITSLEESVMWAVKAIALN